MSDDKIVISPIFGIPAGAGGAFVYSDDSIVIPEQVEVTDTDSSSGDDIGDDSSSDAALAESYEDNTSLPENTMDVPTSFNIISQKIRRAPGGQQVVDIIVSAEDVANAISYEFQVVKI